MASRGSSRGGFQGGRGDFQGGGGRASSNIQIFNPGSGPTQPGPTITRLEDEMISRFKQLPESIRIGDFPPRPGFGTQGEKTLVRANYFPLMVKPGITFYRYKIDISPNEKRRDLRRRILNIYAETAIGRYNVVSDGGEYLFTMEDLPLAELRLSEDRAFSVKLSWPDEPNASSHPNPKQFRIRIQHAGSMTATRLTEEYILGRSKHREPGLEGQKNAATSIVQLFNIILNHGPEMNTKTTSAGKNKFFQLPSRGGISADLGGGLEAVQGFYKSVRPSFGRVMCNINVVASPFHQEISLIEAIGLFLGRRIQDEPLRDIEKCRLACFLRRVKVTLSYLNDRPKVIVGVSNQNANESTFYCDQYDTDMSVRDYFRKKYNCGLRFSRLQLITTGKSMIPAELCTIASEHFRGKINETQTANMIRFACRDPTENATIITTRGLKTLDLTNAEDSTPRSTDVEQGKGQWNIRAQRFPRGCRINKLLVLWFTSVRDRNHNEDTINRLVSQFKETCRDVGIGVGNMRLKSINARNGYNELMDVFKEHSSTAQKPDLLLCFLPDDVKDGFKDIKYFGDIKAGIASVVMLFSKCLKGIDRGNKQYFANVLLKVNIRLGGLNHELEKDDLKPLFTRDGTAMLVGMDVTHPSPSSAKGSPSIASMVASCDDHFMNYPTSMRIQPKGEVIMDTEGMLLERLVQYKRSKGGKPPIIIIYRDGVSEGEYNHVLVRELPQVLSACNRFDPGYRPRITLIVVGKRHHTRFYPMEGRYADERKNCLPGTVVDRGVTDAHKCLQGTAKPAHYYVLRDENGFTADSLQELTMNISHLFARCTKSVSVCPPAKMADIACDRGRVYLASLMDTSGTDSSSQDDPETVYNKARSIWGNGPHPALSHTMFYM
ncbi:hypothetical protein TWF694_004884 [Orbilia ellipsospora]|uniref:Piwi domain-containing protein n=1 Tax=Orbilia ellipsospora TaxID=2528407 RepID=A0AAV9WUZ5_9PEZI